MKLILKPMGSSGGRQFALFDETGAMLPKQRDVVIEQKLRENKTVTVTFVIDGEFIQIG